MYLQGRIPEAHTVYALSESSYVQSLHALNARIGTFRSSITLDEQRLPLEAGTSSLIILTSSCYLRRLASQIPAYPPVLPQ